MGGGVCSSLNISNEKHTMLSYHTTITLKLLQYVHTVNRNITVAFDFVNKTTVRLKMSVLCRTYIFFTTLLSFLALQKNP